MVHVGTSVAAKAHPHDHGTTQVVKNESNVGLLRASASHPDCTMDPDDSDGTSRDPWARHGALDSCGRRDDARPDTCPWQVGISTSKKSRPKTDAVGDLVRVWLDMWYLKDETRRDGPPEHGLQKSRTGTRLTSYRKGRTLEVKPTGWRPHAGKGKPSLRLSTGVSTAVW
jgi:hypothetical protein